MRALWKSVGFMLAVLIVVVALAMLPARSMFRGVREIRGPLPASDMMLVQRSLGSDLPPSFATGCILWCGRGRTDDYSGLGIY